MSTEEEFDRILHYGLEEYEAKTWPLEPIHAQ